MPENYSHPEDLLSDESFLAWYFKTGKEDETSWEQWMENDADRIQLVRQAVSLLEETVIPESPLSAGQVEMAESALFARLGDDAAPLARKVPLYRDKRWMIAASILVVLGAALLWTALRSNVPGEMKTSYGQLSQQELPDGTMVLLNANSRLRYNSNWQNGSSREVWISGEAFFHVRRTAANSKFIVHTDHFYVTVTGTQFNVINRPDGENVLLKEGSIIVGSSKENEIALKPGDFVTWRQNDLKRSRVQPDSLMAWQEQKLVFDKTPLRDLATILGNQYGVRVQLGDSSIADSVISAILPNNNLDVLLKALNATSEYEVTREADLITIKPRGGRQ